MAGFDFLSGPAEAVAPRLLGCHLVRELNGRQLVGRIVEVEAYNQYDAASHSYRGCTPRTDVMFGSAGFLYVYFTYGMHYCCNVVTGKAGEGSAVLIRAIEPLEGEAIMTENRLYSASRHIKGTRSRSAQNKGDLANGPAKLCQAMAIDRSMNGHDLSCSPLQLIVQPPLEPDQIVQTTRIGISRAQDQPWRFFIKGNRFVSKPAAVVG